MRNLRNVLVVLGTVAGGTGAFAVSAVGCSSSSHESSDSGPDVTTDSHFDVQIDTSPEAQADAQGDVVDSGQPDVDSGAAIPPFLTEVATAFCAKLEACCKTNIDSGTFDTASCIAINTPVGYEGTALGAAALLEAGVLTYDPTKAAACLNDINAIDCTGDLITAQQQNAILTDCTAAVYGSLGSGAPCTEAIECASGLFCDLPLDGGVTGACAPLRGDGGACGNFGDIVVNYDFGQSEEACSYRRTGNTGLRCNNEDPNTGNDIDGGPAAWTCEPAGAVGAGCNFNQDCTTQLCDPGAPGYPYIEPDGSIVAGGVTYTCSNSIPFTYYNSCLAFVH
jgi:hypothetical protein